jgi:hypothetical protein
MRRNLPVEIDRRASYRLDGGADRCGGVFTLVSQGSNPYQGLISLCDVN